jgi:hypothetical protein
VAVTPPSQFDQIAFGTAAFVEVLKNVCEIAAIGTGAIWTYYNFFKGRTYKPRLECGVYGTVEAHSGRLFLKVVVKAKNVGLSRVLIEQSGTALLLYAAEIPNASPWPLQTIWSGSPAAFEVFKDHAWAEPSEPVEDQMLIELPDDRAPAYKLILKVLSKKITWTAKNIVGGSEENRIIGGLCAESPGPEAGGPK